MLKDRTATLGLPVPTGGAGKILAAAAKTRRTTDLFSERKRTTRTIGYGYSMSKRTELYAYLLNDKVASFENERSLAAGVRHRFWSTPARAGIMPV